MTTAHAYDANLADFDHKVIAASREVPVLVDFWADWCQPCRILKPILEKLAAEYGGRIKLAKVNSDENQELAVRYGVRGIPAVKAFIGGEMVDEFTGALPEAKVREFIERLIPSPAEPLRLDAAQARSAGDFAGARQMLLEAIAFDPANEAAQLDLAEIFLDEGAIEEARGIIDARAEGARDRTRVEALAARLQLAASGGSADVAELERKLAADPADLPARLQLANALALRHEYRPAFGHLLDIVRRDRRWNDEAGRKTLLTLFNLLGGHPEHDDLVREFRIALARTLN